MTPFDQFRATADRVKPRAAVVLGSGLAGVAELFVPAAVVGYGDVPGLVPPSVAGHRGLLAVGAWGGVTAVVCFGRVHLYEGHPWERVTRLVALAAELGVRALVLTNAAGGIRADLGPGSLMPIRGHLKLLGGEAWRALTVNLSPYSPRFLAALASPDLAPPGVYAALTGPSYETPAEIRFLRTAGADAVGMSTAVEAEAAAGLGLEVAAVSCITNHAAGLSPGPLSHQEVEANALLAVNSLGRIVSRVLRAV